jgi:hypothetical protein
MRRYLFSVVAATLVWACANLAHYYPRVTCWDCFWPYGLPFTFYRQGGFAGGGGWVWSGVLGDLTIVLLVGFLVGTMWNLSRQLLRTK